MTGGWQSRLAKGQRLPDTVVYAVLGNERRRSAIEELHARAEEVSLRDLSEAIASRESGEAPAPRKLRESVYGSLHQTHLPTLDRHGLVEYDALRKEVRPQPRTRDLGPYLEVRGPRGVTWVGIFQWLGIVGLFLLVGALADLPLVAHLPPLAVGSAFLAAFAGASAYRLWRLRGLVRGHTSARGRREP